MPIEVELPDGNIAEFPEGTPNSVMESALAQHFQPQCNSSQNIQQQQQEQSQKQQQEPPSLWDRASHSMSLGTRNLIEGLGRGASLGMGDPGRVVSDWMGLAKPQTDAERTRGAIIEGAAGTLPMLGAGSVMAKAASPLVRGVGETMSAAPAVQMAGDSASGAASESARQNGEGAGTQMLAGLAGGMVPGSLYGAGRTAGRGLGMVVNGLDALSSPGQQKIAGATLRRMATDRNGLENTIRTAGDAEFVPGSRPTLAQITQDPGIAALERSLKDTDSAGGAIANRYHDQTNAQQDALAGVWNATNPRVAGLRAKTDTNLGKTVAETDAEGIGRKLLDARTAQERAFKDKNVTPKYQAVDPDGTSNFLVQPILDDAESFAGQMFGKYRVENPDSATTRQINAMRQAAKESGTVPFSELQNWRSALSEAARADVKAGNNRQAAVANHIREWIDGYITDMDFNAGLRGQQPQIGKSHPLYRDATQYAESAVGGDPFYDDMAEIAKRGINKDAFVRLFGQRSFDDVHAAYPNLIRKNGTLDPSQLGADMASARAGGFETDYAPRDATGFVNMIVDRFGPQTQSRKQQVAQLRDQYIADNLPAHTGVSPEGAQAYQEAQDATKRMYADYRNGPNKGLNAYDGTAEKVPSRYFHKGAGGKEDVNTFLQGVGKDPQAVQGLRQYALSDAASAATGGGRGKASSQGLKNWMFANRGAIDSVPGLRADVNRMLRDINLTESAEKGFNSAFKVGQDGTINPSPMLNSQLFDWRKGGTFRDRLVQSGAFTPEQLDSLSAVRSDIARARSADRLASTSGSATAKNLATQHILDRALGGDVGRVGTESLHNRGLTDNLIARATQIPANFIGDKLQKIFFGDADSVVRDYLTEAMLDPNVALELLKKGKIKNIPSMGNVLSDTGKAMGMTGMRSLLDMFQNE